VTRIGSADLSQVPDWVPQADDLKDAVSMFHSETENKITGQFSGKSAKTSADLEAELSAKGEALGTAAAGRSSATYNGISTLTLKYAGEGKTLTIVITEKPSSDTLINTHYSETK